MRTPHHRNGRRGLPGGPSGECGLIEVATFERDPAEKLSAFWNYKTRKIVTNKKGTAVLLACSALDENEYAYSWKTQDFFKGCDYVRYGF